VTALSDAALRVLVDRDPARGWRTFVDQYTPTLVVLIERAGVNDRDDQADVYVQVCDRLSADGCARLKRYDPAKGALAAWLNRVVANAVVDWIRSRAGRRRLFDAIERLSEFDQRVFELYYWERHRATEIAGIMSQAPDCRTSIADVFDALERIERSMSDRQRGQLLSLMIRTQRPVDLESVRDGPVRPLAHREHDPETTLRVKRLDEAFAASIAELGAEDAAIVRMVYGHGWSLQDVRRALHLAELTRERLRGILARLRSALERRGVEAADAAAKGLGFFEERP
jgi:DNA-directed RNA polymerase specialized sigma24 family protein